MAQTLVIVESPAKAKTIEKFLGKGFKVLASYGHVRALPSKQGSVDIANDFEPKYHILPESKKHVDLLKKEAARSSELILATDLDREGEAIAWHLLEALEISEESTSPVVKRVTFHEITKKAILKAMEEPRHIARDLVDAQQARSILDYLVGFNLSPFLWKKIRYGLSAGRVQSVALRLICDREKEIQGFDPREYWTIEADMATERKEPFRARLHAVGGERLDKFAIATTAEAEALVADLEKSRFAVTSVARSEKKRNPAAPFTTSTLQQEASRKLGFSARKTMTTAQKLYEGIDIGQGDVGLITYMRTDSVALSEEATDEAREVITRVFGKEYALEKPRVYKSKAKNAQEAHEAVRPTAIINTPDKVKPFLSSDQHRLYSLIWTRTVASQMASAILDATTVDIGSTPGAPREFTFRASGQVIRFPGFMKLYIEGTDEAEEKAEGLLPLINEGEGVERGELYPEQHFTQPPPRYTEASLVKTLEEYGIGRPSTYASIMNTLVTRKYVRLEKRAFFPEDVGMVVSDLLVKHFHQYVDYDFTAKLEEDLDAISRGEEQWRPVLRGFWDPFIALLKQKEQEVSKEDVTTEKTDKLCPECSKPLVVKLGRSGKFLACSGFPECRHTEPLSGEEQEEPVLSEEKCDKCGAPMLIKMGRFGKFLACSAYPACKNIQPLIKPKALGITCPECKEGEMMEKKSRYGKIFYSCNRYPQCKYALWDLPINEPCPKCGHPVIVEKVTKRDGTYRKCPTETCDYRLVLVEPEKKAAAKKAPAKAPADKKEPVKKAPAKKAPTKTTAAAGAVPRKVAVPAKKKKPE
ncbi:DNA topoisomerase I [Desulfuromonas soudanensis]|uniref:DNA topoisomerase 1 n=1 Tax=Desulfuromonas soudanensis TaxID=1603606 RepID=A0A0M4CV36_9BACT|nr:type I DNA topoisomerase [Desulfuromonas soudanensis]ALC15516.1 DNA topoisomerase I [Desulfuromonas soudanensis]